MLALPLMTAPPLIAFAGPSIPRPEVERLCPGLDIRPPIRRGDLYRERERGAWGFLIIDGVFMAAQAVSPREVVDVLADGALVLGAASMGALRAADCWPAGAVGLGAIYRLYRRGILDSDEEVAVSIRADGSDLAASVPLVNVRYAVRRAVRRGILNPEMASAIVQEASVMYYPERTWREVLHRAGVNRPEVLEFCAPLDLKGCDAKRAISHVRTLLQEGQVLALRHRRNHEAPFARSETTRERGYDVYDGIPPERLSELLFDWMVGSGRIARYVLQAREEPAGSHDKRGEGPKRLWQVLERSGELDAELMRLKAVRTALLQAERCALQTRPRDLRMARRQIACDYGFRNWDALLNSELGQAKGDLLRLAGEQLARAKRVRDAWFNPRSLNEPCR